MKVLYVWQARYPWDVRVEKICRALVRHGVSVELLARRGAGESEADAIDGFAVHRVGGFSLPVPGNPVWSTAIQRRVREFRPDVIIARDIPLALPALASGVPVVIDMAEHYPAAMRIWKKYQQNPFARFLINVLRVPDRIEKKSVQRAAGILVVCEEMKVRLEREFGLPASRITSVLNTPARIPEAPSFSRRGAVFGYHGIITRDRDLLTVVKGFSLAAAADPSIRLVIAGDGECFDEIRAEAARSPFASRISLPGRYRSDDLERLYSETDFGIVSWKVNELSRNTIANKFFDYAAYGKPILYTDVPPMANLMRTMKSGVAFSGNDPASVAQGMLALLRADYASLARAGRAAVEKDLNWNVDAKRMTDFLEHL